MVGGEWFKGRHCLIGWGIRNHNMLVPCCQYLIIGWPELHVAHSVAGYMSSYFSLVLVGRLSL